MDSAIVGAMAGGVGGVSMDVDVAGGGVRRPASLAASIGLATVPGGAANKVILANSASATSQAEQNKGGVSVGGAHTALSVDSGGQKGAASSRSGGSGEASTG